MKKYSLSYFRISHLLLLNFAVILIVTAIFGFLGGAIYAKSALLGVLAWTLPSIYFVKRWFSFQPKSIHNVLCRLYLFELLKLLLSAVLIVLIVQWISISLLPFLIGYIVSIVSFWLLSILILVKYSPL